MKFADMLTYWRLNGMASMGELICQTSQYQADDKPARPDHYIKTIRIADDGFKHADVIFRTEGDNVAFIYADIKFSKWMEGSSDLIFIKNCKVQHLENEFIG